MDSRVSLGSADLANMPILYVLLAVVILLTLLAALGAWARGGGIKRQDAESLFSESRERQREEMARLEALLEETRRANEEAQQTLRQVQERNHELMTSRLQEVDQQVQRSRSGLEAALSQASAEYTEALSDELEMVARKLGETDRRLSNGLTELNGSLNQIQTQVAQAGEQIRSALIEITRQQQEQKAQSTIQLCEALISSLGTLKNSIAHQLEDNQSQPLTAEFSLDEQEQPALTQGGYADLQTEEPSEEQISAVDPPEDVADNEETLTLTAEEPGEALGSETPGDEDRKDEAFEHLGDAAGATALAEADAFPPLPEENTLPASDLDPDCDKQDLS